MGIAAPGFIDRKSELIVGIRVYRNSVPAKRPSIWAVGAAVAEETSYTRLQSRQVHRTRRASKDGVFGDMNEILRYEKLRVVGVN
jgi:hypothetical protein